MKKSNQKGILFGFLAVATMASVMGTISGTLAWYAYATRATVSYSGTSVNNTVQVQIGLASDIEIALNEFPEGTEVLHKQFDGDPTHYYFAPVGLGLTSDIISTYLGKAGYGSNSLAPITTGSYVEFDPNDPSSVNPAFELKESPKDDAHFNTRSANHKYYAQIPFVFRVLNSNNPDSESFIEGQQLWLTDAQVRASEVFDEDGINVNEGSEIHKAIRMYIDRDATMGYAYDYILNPSATAHGQTKVGGVLDLTRDGYFDFDNDGKEIIYGEYDEDAAAGQISADGYNDQAEPLIDINGSGVEDKNTTFTAKHYQNVNYYTQNGLNNCGIKTADYKCLSDIVPERDEESGAFINVDPNDPLSVCKTAGSEDNYLARLNMTVYLEGWDFSVVDEELEHYFDLGLTFEINRVS